MQGRQVVRLYALDPLLSVPALAAVHQLSQSAHTLHCPLESVTTGKGALQLPGLIVGERAVPTCQSVGAVQSRAFRRQVVAEGDLAEP